MAESTRKPVEVRLTDETISYLDQRIADAVRVGISQALQEALTKDTAQKFWSAGFEMLQEQASVHAGRFVVGGLWGLIRKASMFLVLGGVVYAIGGWAGLAKLWHILFGAAS
jgi:hypothetical protein